jgi:hypothetical protein
MVATQGGGAPAWIVPELRRADPVQGQSVMPNHTIQRVDSTAEYGCSLYNAGTTAVR